MQDGIIKGTGNSRKLKSAITEATTWEQFRAALIAGTLPIDLAGINSAGWQQIGDALSKGNLLSDTTAALINTLVGSTPSTPDAALSAITGKTQALYNGRVQIATGSYTGTGTYGSGNPITLNFGIDAKILILASQINSQQIVAMMPIVIPKMKSLSGSTISLATYGSRMVTLVRASDDVSGNTSFKFYCSGETDAAYANPSGYSVTWVAIG